MTEQSRSQPQTSTSTTTGIFALLTAKPGVTRERVMAIMPAEIRATVQLYLEGKIREWYAREDGRGAIFLLNASAQKACPRSGKSVAPYVATGASTLNRWIICMQDALYTRTTACIRARAGTIES
jgi:hypothetical protein